jgi:hypothetical protein
MRPPYRDLLLSALVLCTLAYSWMFAGASVPNERSRAYLTVALVEQGRLSIDGPIARFGSILDLAESKGKHYCDKAPGTSFVAAPVYAVARLIAPWATRDITSILTLLRSFVMVPIGLLGFWVLRSLLRRLAVSERAVDVASLSYAIGQTTFHYSTAFYGHAMVATLSLVSLRAWAALGMFDAAPALPSSLRRQHGLALAAGASAGLMGLIEYQAIVLALLMALPLAFMPRARAFPLALSFALGGLPSAVALLTYNRLAFGGVFELSYHHLVGEGLQAIHGKGLAGATFPRWWALRGILLSRHRGLLAVSPVLALGFVALVRPGLLARPLRWLVFLSSVYMILIVASSNVWTGGWSFGPRLLIPIAPLLTVAAGLVIDRMIPRNLLGTLVAGAVLLGIAQSQLLQVTFSEPPENVGHPIAHLAMPLLQQGLIAPNLLCKVMPLGLANLLPLLLVLAACTLWIVGCCVPRSRLRIPYGLLSMALPVVVLAFWSWTAPAQSKKDREGWPSYVRTLTGVETGCVAPRGLKAGVAATVSP